MSARDNWEWVEDQEDLREAIHRASFGHRLMPRHAAALLRAYMRTRCELSAREIELDTMRAELDSQRAVIAHATGWEKP